MRHACDLPNVPTIREQFRLTRRAFLGRASAGLGTMALASLLNARPLAQPPAADPRGQPRRRSTRCTSPPRPSG